ncbi:MAG: hypothetical protein AAF074_24040 [Pseudomonadota bacterium]
MSRFEPSRAPPRRRLHRGGGPACVRVAAEDSDASVRLAALEADTPLSPAIAEAGQRDAAGRNMAEALVARSLP